MASDDDPASARQRALQLMQKSKELEDEIQDQMQILKANNATLTSPLLDPQGFPLAELDLPTIRSARSKIIMLRNDNNQLRQQIALLLESALSASQSQPALKQTTAVDHLPPSPSSHTNRKPFARVNSVVQGSPSSTAGLRENDLIIRFESLDSSNNDRLRALPSVVTEGRTIQLLILRNSSEEVGLSLTPRSDWGGRGLLGCHLLPI
ncbi:hypothetical protein IE53DRAFT_217005 [Violaceomyces palustris]|uniref:Uncharacterized protein n=1 Tax=Violaceomyces palustris TaxID=1673888 RepID=A0ACD0P4N1_9BASI|nr:hypothetical protein IE53DRAFT_217005 [Violaceomyces palustris]